MDIEQLAEAAEATYWIQRGWYRGTGHERFPDWFARFERQEKLGLPAAFRACGIRQDEATRHAQGYSTNLRHDRYTADRVAMMISVISTWERRFPPIHLVLSQALAAMPKVAIRSRT